VREALKEIARQLEAYVARKIPAGIKTSAVVADGNPAEEIIKQARQANAT
jgi:nucleotide-binding universal stress UspA family protein